ncbi:predicted protein [Sclerotinia sclerotiorum 1980 UF-70]|uniref:Uncharacterized protein n=1 Tax=Sclerotinia sclerotiorum (strain ATCC 18683 / 1980 / Ss-1) TaxID=665079 RepID=A7END4_SCLS1|nr:predicted protein [Sclerotinia sclerotiorum 1980 UF-70]EDO04350.1 predicted protein [Sclerotinia sclerotiorum 1980 UF-70]
MAVLSECVGDSGVDMVSVLEDSDGIESANVLHISTIRGYTIIEESRGVLFEAQPDHDFGMLISREVFNWPLILEKSLHSIEIRFKAAS